MSGRCDYCGEVGNVACGSCLAPDVADALRRRIATLEARLRRLMEWASTSDPLVWRGNEIELGRRGRVWSRRRSPKGGR